MPPPKKPSALVRLRRKGKAIGLASSRAGEVRAVAKSRLYDKQAEALVTMLSERNTDSCLGSLDNIMKTLQTQDRFAFSQMLNKIMAGAMKMKNSATIAAVDRVRSVSTRRVFFFSCSRASGDPAPAELFFARASAGDARSLARGTCWICVEARDDSLGRHADGGGATSRAHKSGVSDAHRLGEPLPSTRFAGIIAERLPLLGCRDKAAAEWSSVMKWAKKREFCIKIKILQ